VVIVRVFCDFEYCSFVVRGGEPERGRWTIEDCRYLDEMIRDSDEQYEDTGLTGCCSSSMFVRRIVLGVFPLCLPGVFIASTTSLSYIQ